MLSVWKVRKNTTVHGSKNRNLSSKNLKASSLGHSGSGAGNGRRACSYVSGTWIPPLISLWLPVNFKLSDFCQSVQSGNKGSSAKGDDIITNVISTNQHFTLTFLMQIYSNSRDVVASSPFFSHPASRVSQRACLPPNAVTDFKMMLQWSYPGLQHLTAIKCGRKPKSVTSLMCFPANQ